jgi:cysteine desulfurase/selenocysteine lyase
MPLHEKMSLTATARASFYVYNRPSDIDRLTEALDQVRELFGG